MEGRGQPRPLFVQRPTGGGAPLLQEPFSIVRHDSSSFVERELKLALEPELETAIAEPHPDHVAPRLRPCARGR